MVAELMSSSMLGCGREVTAGHFWRNATTSLDAGSRDRLPDRGTEALMNGWTALTRFLHTDPRDVGCAEAMDMLHVYADLVAAGVPAEQRYPGVAAHLRGCGPCGEDFEGLLAVIAGEAP
jgi:hypothetical protein